MVVRVRDVEQRLSAILKNGKAEAAGFAERRQLARSVVPAHRPGTQHRLHRAGQRQNFLDFVVVRVGNEQLALMPFNADGVLQPHVMLHPVPVSKGKQIYTHQRRHPPGHRVDAGAAHAAGLGIGEVQDGTAAPVAAHHDAAGLRQRRLGQRAVVDVLPAGAGVGTYRPVGQRQPPQLVDARHGDVQSAVVVRQVPRAAERDLSPRPGGAAVMPLLPRARDGIHRASRQIHPADGVVLGVGNVQRIPHQLHALRMVERGAGVVAVREVLGAGTDDS